MEKLPKLSLALQFLFFKDPRSVQILFLYPIFFYLPICPLNHRIFRGLVLCIRPVLLSFLEYFFILSLQDYFIRNFLINFSQKFVVPSYQNRKFPVHSSLNLLTNWLFWGEILLLSRQRSILLKHILGLCFSFLSYQYWFFIKF